MDVTPLVPKGKLIIHAYGDGGFRIGNLSYKGAVIVTPDAVVPWGVVPSPNPLPQGERALEAGPITPSPLGGEGWGEGDTFTEQDFAPLLALAEKPEILLVGTGKTMRMLPPALREALKREGIVADAMDTGAACRTYNVLLGEGRSVAAALMAV